MICLDFIVAALLVFALDVLGLVNPRAPAHVACFDPIGDGETLCVLALVLLPVYYILQLVSHVYHWCRFRKSQVRKFLHHGHEIHHLHRAHTRALADVELGILRPAVLPLQSVLWAKWNYDVLVEVYKYLHYEDILSLSRTCRAFHGLIFPPGQLIEEQQRWKRVTCDQPYSCWACNGQICKVYSFNTLQK